MKAPGTAITVVLVVAALSGCSPSDPIERALDERTRWNVTLLSWAMSSDGSINLSTRVSGPADAELKQLTVRILLQDAEGNTVDRAWQTLDLSGIERGGPEDILLRLAPRGQAIEGIGIDPVHLPGPDELPHIPELQP
jgi:hypothetical protein